MEVTNDFYVYMYCKPDGIPFYVGKGKEDRWEHHVKQAKKQRTTDSNKLKINTIRKILKQGQEPLIKFIDINLSEDQAFELEEFMIGWIGRLDLGTGTLTNMTNGGEGLSGLVRDLSGKNNPNYGNTGEKCVWWGRNHTEETKKKMSEAQKGRILSEEHKAKMRKPKSEDGRANIAKARIESNYRPSDETKRKTSEALKGRPSPRKGKTWTDEQRLKMSEQRKGLLKPKKTCPHCNRAVAINTYNRWHGDNCKENNKDVS
jgi:hypothetical protein